MVRILFVTLVVTAWPLTVTAEDEPFTIPPSPIDLIVPDEDFDGLGDVDEDIAGTNPKNEDSDGDGVLDGEEVHLFHTDPRSVDSDADELQDEEEIIIGTNPNSADTDGDGLSDRPEAYKTEIPIGRNWRWRRVCSDPTLYDTDGDGRSDRQELVDGTDACNYDTDGDGLSDGEEAALRTNPLKRDSDGDGICDGDQIHCVGVLLDDPLQSPTLAPPEEEPPAEPEPAAAPAY